MRREGANCSPSPSTVPGPPGRESTLGLTPLLLASALGQKARLTERSRRAGVNRWSFRSSTDVRPSPIFNDLSSLASLNRSTATFQRRFLPKKSRRFHLTTGTYRPLLRLHRRPCLVLTSRLLLRLLCSSPAFRANCSSTCCRRRWQWKALLLHLRRTLQHPLDHRHHRWRLPPCRHRGAWLHSPLGDLDLLSHQSLLLLPGLLLLQSRRFRLRARLPLHRAGYD